MFLDDPWKVDSQAWKRKHCPKERAKARRKEKQQQWGKEVNAVHALRERTVERKPTEGDIRRRQQYLVELEAVQAKLQTDQFRIWYEATTGEPYGPWVQPLLASDDEWLRSGKYARFGQQVEWIYSCVKSVVESNPWTNPYRKALWADELQHVESSSERRRILVRLATPTWACRSSIEAIYLERLRKERETGIPHDVDHIVPIVHPLVCGLHVPANLRVIPARENRQKSNIFQVGA